MKKKFTRGESFLDNFLAILRSKKADSLIPDDKRKGTILDIGCGLFPYFLTKTKFKTKVGVDKIKIENVEGIKIININIEKINYLPFKDETFDVVTSLAVFEHIERAKILKIFKEIKRILKKGGFLILTTPNYFSDFLLKAMAKLRIVSHEEILEHKKLFKKKELIELLVRAGFERKNIEAGYFELGFNIYVRAKK
ncbi:MAG: methyltransferase domain-containing protein [Candidatus Hydrothermales bacterium]